MNEIKLQKNNDNREWDDLEWIKEFYNFLQGEKIEGIHFRRGHHPKLRSKKAFAIIYFLQEQLPVFPANIELCSNCGGLFDSHSEGIYWETKCKHFCDACSDLVPDNYDRVKR